MLELTSSAVSAIAAIVDKQGLPDQAGLRIAQTDDGSAMTATAAARSEAEEATVEQNGARVFLTPTVAEALTDKILDAQVDTSGRVGFYVGPRPPRSSE